jgi:2-keto-3-deoxy-L-rhamnonate aldolase RhmA
MTILRTNPIRDRLLAGEAAFGIMAFEFFTPGLLPMLAAAGADYVVLDMEHSGVGPDTIKGQLGAARGTGVVPIVRVPGKAPHLIAPILDAGALGIMVPLVETAVEARAIADACRYRPLGRRGLGFSLGHDDYSSGDVRVKIAESNARTLVIAMIESETGIANADEIMAVSGIDVGWLGHYDLTDSMGIAGDFADPRFEAAVRKLVAATERHGKTAGFLAGSLEQSLEWRAKGFRCLAYGTDVGLLRDALAQGLAALRASELHAGQQRRSKMKRK